MSPQTPTVRVTTPLTRSALAADSGDSAAPAPVRIVHLGLGAFARAHQAWYTSRVDHDNEWGIAAFTGRTPAVAEELEPQDGLFTLVERSAESDSATIVTSIVEVHDGANVERLVELVAAPETVVVTMTVTESGYRLRVDGTPDLDDPIVVADIAALRDAVTSDATGTGVVPTSALARLVLGLAARRRADAGPLAVVPCDNMPDNGAYVRRGTIELARRTDPDLAEWIEQNVAFVSTSVDRITPRTTADDVELVSAETGWADSSPVITEPFSDWVLSGDFPGGRPAWECAGARFVVDIEPFERRKLWLLNGAHSLLAYLGARRGHRTVAEAIADPVCAAMVDALWDEACRHLPDGLDLEAYRGALLERFRNGRIAHHLAQISGEGSAKLRVRAVPVARAERAQGRSAAAAANVIGAWAVQVIDGAELIDAQRDAIVEAARAADPVRSLVAVLDENLAADEVFLRLVKDAVTSLS